MKMQLTRPIAFLDLETTGTDVEKDRIVEIAVCKFEPSSGQYATTRRLINPTIPIPAGASEVHGIKDEDVANEPTFKQIAKGLLALLDGCDIAGFNSNRFDVPLLFNEFHRAGLFWDYKQFLMIDVGNLFKIKHPRTLSDAVRIYLGREMENAHSAEADIEATLDVFLAQIEKHENDEGFPQTLEELALYTNFDKKVIDLGGKFTYNNEGEIILTIGEHKDKPARNHLGFLQWMVDKANFSADTKAVARQIIESARQPR